MKADSEGIPEDHERRRHDDHLEDVIDSDLDDNDTEHSGFSGTCETTLIDWIQLVQMGRRDAVISVRTHEGREGTLWCRDGDIIDADCDGALGEHGVFRALSWKGGRVSVEFGPVKKQRQIATATAGLLLRAAYRRDSGIHELGNFVDPAERSDAREAFDLDNDTTEVVEASLFFSLARSAKSDHESPYVQASPARPGRRPLSLRFAIAGGFSVLVLFSALAWKWMYPAPSPSPVEPAVAAERSVPEEIAPAPAAPPEPALAAPIPAAARATAVSAPAPVVRRPAPPAPGASGLARHHAVALALVRRSAASSPALASAHLSEGARASSPSRGKVDLVRSVAEPRQPRVQIIEDGERPQPRIQIIDDHKPRIQSVE